MLKVLEEMSKLDTVSGTGQVFVQSDLGRPGNFSEAFYELEGNEAIRVAQAWAAKNGLPSPGVQSSSAPFPLNSEGLELDKIKDDKGDPLPPQHPRLQPARYCVMVSILGRPV